MNKTLKEKITMKCKKDKTKQDIGRENNDKILKTKLNKTLEEKL